MRVPKDTTEPRFLFNVKANHKVWSYINHNRIMKILRKANHPVEIIGAKDYPAYLEKKRKGLI